MIIFYRFKKGNIIAIIGIAIWTVMTVGWDAWSDEFVRKWNEGLDSNKAY